jgi:hypothetical protein
VRTLVALFVLVGALALAPGVLAAASLTVTPASVTSGGTFTVTACVATSGHGGYLIVKGPDTFTQDFSFGPATPCSTFEIGTAGWAAGKYRINGFEFTAKGAKGIGSATVTVT